MWLADRGRAGAGGAERGFGAGCPGIGSLRRIHLGWLADVPGASQRFPGDGLFGRAVAGYLRTTALFPGRPGHPVGELSPGGGSQSADSGFNFNGYGGGRLAITVPEGWKVSVTCENRGPLNHSCAIVRGPTDSQPAIVGASSPNPVSGQPAGAVTTFDFTAQAQGTYRIACLVPGHEQAGMWDTFTITGARNQPTAQVRQ